MLRLTTGAVQTKRGVIQLSRLLSCLALMSLLMLLNLLPCIDHCTQKERIDQGGAVFFLCAMPLTHTERADPGLPHHHHHLRVSLEPFQVFVSTLGASLLLTARFALLPLLAPATLLRTPLTPPPRLA
jgi:hypothetical protein